MKKVGLITYYGDNYGGVLQAYALARMVADNGYECEIISNDFLWLWSGVRKYLRKWNNLMEAIRNPAGYLKKRKTYRRYRPQQASRHARFEDFRSRNLRIRKTGYSTYQEYLNDPPRYDIYLCGSDQIWNPNLYCDNGFYFAGFAPEKALKISYASSIGVSSVTGKQADFMAPLLNRLDIVSTREQKGAQIINRISRKKAAVVLDPTLLLDAEAWSKAAAPRLIEEEYVFCYLFGERDYIAEVKGKVAELTGLKVVCIPFAARELESDDEKIFDAGPAEFISLIQNASLVLTDSFHATAFSLNLKTPFLSLCRFARDDKKGMNDRLVTLLTMVGLQNRLVDAGDAIPAERLLEVDFEKAHDRLERKRREDLRFLLEALSYDKEGVSDGDL